MAKICESSLSDFNSQPREGGWGYRNTGIKGASNFNSQPREGGWGVVFGCRARLSKFQLTAARRRLVNGLILWHMPKYFNSQPREGGWPIQSPINAPAFRFQLTAARRRLVPNTRNSLSNSLFQLTAARRRLGQPATVQDDILGISTHSRAKAAGLPGLLSKPSKAFQLTAARRRLVPPLKPLTRKACIALFR